MAEGFGDCIAFLERITDLDGVSNAVGEAMNSDSVRVAAVTGVREHFINSEGPDGTPWPQLQHDRPGSTGGSPLRDTDRMMAATFATSEGSSVTVLNNRRQAMLQHHGGVIVPVNVTFLTIPATVEAKRAGGASMFPGTLVPRINSERTGGVMIDENEVVQYYLTKRSVIPPRPFIGFSAQTQEIILDIVAERVGSYAFGGAA